MSSHFVITPGCWGILASAGLSILAVVYSEFVEKARNRKGSLLSRRKPLILFILCLLICAGALFSCYWCSQAEQAGDAKQLENAIIKSQSLLREVYLREIRDPSLSLREISYIRDRLENDLQIQVAIAGVFARLPDTTDKRFENAQIAFEKAHDAIVGFKIESPPARGPQDGGGESASAAASGAFTLWTKVFGDLRESLDGIFENSP